LSDKVYGIETGIGFDRYRLRSRFWARES